MCTVHTCTASREQVTLVSDLQEVLKLAIILYHCNVHIAVSGNVLAHLSITGSKHAARYATGYNEWKSRIGLERRQGQKSKKGHWLLVFIIT